MMGHTISESNAKDESPRAALVMRFGRVARCDARTLCIGSASRGFEDIFIS